MGSNTKRAGDPFWEMQQSYRSEQSMPLNWKPMYFFKKINDRSLFNKTCGKFPRAKRKEDLAESATHPVFLLKRSGNFSYSFCPCSTKRQGNYSYIPAKTKLELAPEAFPANGYIYHKITFNQPPENGIIRPDNFFGIVREDQIVGDQYKEGMQ